MNTSERRGALKQLDDARAAYQRAQVDLTEVDATIARLERPGGEDMDGAFSLRLARVVGELRTSAGRQNTSASSSSTRAMTG